MPLYNVDIEKLWNNIYWSNRYVVSTPTLEAALAAGQQIVGWERAVTSTQVQFTKVRASDQTPKNYMFYTEMLNQPGLQTFAADLLPLFVCVRIDFTVGPGRPCRKFLRHVVAESAQANGTIVDTTLTHIANTYGQPLLNSGLYVDESGNAFTKATVHKQLVGRQLRRGSKKKLTPILGD